MVYFYLLFFIKLKLGVIGHNNIPKTCFVGIAIQVWRAGDPRLTINVLNEVATSFWEYHAHSEWVIDRRKADTGPIIPAMGGTLTSQGDWVVVSSASTRDQLDGWAAGKWNHSTTRNKIGHREMRRRTEHVNLRCSCKLMTMLMVIGKLNSTSNLGIRMSMQSVVCELQAYS